MEMEAQSCRPAGNHLLHGRPHHQPRGGGEDEWGEYFPCPFCYREVEVPFLCNHLQHEHCFDMKNAVCPICADRIGDEAAAHFRVQHSHLLKRRTSASPAIEEQECGDDEDSDSEETSHCSRGKQAADPSPPDPLLWWFICGVAPADSRPGEAEDEADVSPIPDDGRRRPDERMMDDEASTQDTEERLQRIEFVKQMLMTTIA